MFIHGKGDPISDTIYKTGTWDSFTSSLLPYFVKSGHFAIDVGANIGWYTVLLGELVGPEGRIDAYEPDMANRTLLRLNSILSPLDVPVYIYSQALLNTSQHSHLYRSSSNFGDHRLYPDKYLTSPRRISAVTLDAQYFDSHRRPDFLKIDTQGSELHILEGASSLFTAGWRPIMVIEYWPHGLVHARVNPLKLIAKLEALGYELFIIRSDLSQLEISKLSLIATYTRSVHFHESYDRHFDLLCLHNSMTPQYDAIISRFSATINN